MTTKIQNGKVLWLTGLSGAGKTTIALRLRAVLGEMGINALILDGDDVRGGLCKDLGFSMADRDENVRRVAELSALLSEQSPVIVVALISPRQKHRATSKQIVSHRGGRFFEVFVKAPLDVCEKRDPKGLYQKVRAGKLNDFTGKDSDYEEPTSPDLVVHTDRESAAECAARIVSLLEI